MRRVALVATAIVLFTQVSELRAQASSDTIANERQSGFANAVSSALDRMEGKWKIESAKLTGADLSLDPFESLTVDDDGFTLIVQKRTTRFEFAEFNRKYEVFVAQCSSPDYPKGLAYEIGVAKDVIKIRYRTNGTHIAPDPSTKDNELFVQVWTKSEPK